MQALHRYKHVLWDWNGTIIDDMPLALDIVNDMLTRREMNTISREQYVTLFEHPVSEFYRAIGFDLAVVPFDEITSEFGQAYARSFAHCALQNGALDALGTLKAMEVPQSILSASHRGALEDSVNQYGLRHYFAALTGLDNYRAHSKVEEGRLYLKSLPLKPHEVVLIGDTTHDYAVARELGCDCILISRGHESKSRLEATGAPVLECLQQLVDAAQ